jgi:hypothetical protein
LWEHEVTGQIALLRCHDFVDYTGAGVFGAANGSASCPDFECFAGFVLRSYTHVDSRQSKDDV